MPEQIKPKVTVKYLYIAIPLVMLAVVWIWHQRTIAIKRECSTEAETTAQELYISALGTSPYKDVANKEIERAKEQGLYPKDAYEFSYKKCLELKGL